MASKGGRDKIKLESTAGTGHFYTTTKNKRTKPEKMEIMKFDPSPASTSLTRKPRSSNPRAHHSETTRLVSVGMTDNRNPLPGGFFVARHLVRVAVYTTSLSDVSD